MRITEDGRVEIKPGQTVNLKAAVALGLIEAPPRTISSSPLGSIFAEALDEIAEGHPGRIDRGAALAERMATSLRYRNYVADVHDPLDVLAMVNATYR